jgi:hypothetical protein
VKSGAVTKEAKGAHFTLKISVINENIVFLKEEIQHPLVNRTKYPSYSVSFKILKLITFFKNSIIIS